MLDRFVAGEVARISPEAPVPVLKIAGQTEMLGGVGNVARNLAGLGAGAVVVASVGDDDAARWVDGQIKSLAGADATLIEDPARPTAIKTRFLAGNQQIMRADREDLSPFDPSVGEALFLAAKGLLEDCRVLVLSDYGKGVLADGRAAALIAAAKAAGRSVIVDPKGSDYAIYAGADLVTPNRKELADATGMPTGTLDDAMAAAASLRERHGFGAVLATLSGDGMALVTEAGALHVGTEAREVSDVSGAGDTVVATVAAALAAGGSLEDAVGLANAAAGIVVGKVGTASVYMAELVAALHHQEISRAEAKVMTLDEMRDRAEVWRRQGLKVGFTNGCFDLLHPGHVSLLAQAKAQSDRLIVGLNSDASVGRLKGPSRPVQTEMARATVLASLASVDAVVIFAEDTPLETISHLKPDVLVKGADYAKRDVVGGAEVESWGGRVHLADLEPGHSTTKTIERLAAGGGDAET